VALGRRGLVTVGAAVACCALTAACTSEPAPGATSSPTSHVATPSESQIEREMRLDYEAAEKAYRANMAEQDRQSQLGIAVKTEELTSTASGNYLRFVLQVLRDIRDSGWRAQGATTIRGVVRDGWQQDQVLLTACEDSTDVKFTDEKGRDVTPKHVTRTYVQHLTVTRDQGRWRVSDVASQSVKTYAGVTCAA
jgi:hypothetical protein